MLGNGLYRSFAYLSFYTMLFNKKIFNYSGIHNKTICYDITLGPHVKKIRLGTCTDKKIYNKIHMSS